MANVNQIMFMAIVAIIFTLTLIGIYILMNKANERKRQLIDLEQRLHAQEELLQRQQEIEKCQPAMVKEGHQIHQAPSYVIMTPQKEKKKSDRESFLDKVYGFRSATSPFIAETTSNKVAPKSSSFLQMTERAPPAYGDIKASVYIKSTDLIREK
ncbi:hypothetical protein A0J61_07095 [Choanephora cucurbitarum]|uniref:Uncharacterized protein n=1 Tax=Choanephora cucurbitarum TaxID=101091 RepID=A0A1C7N6Y6_9FUNG|nr:hypothetical protein A0J61_07095 [Choanephora cucurbitarum]